MTGFQTYLDNAQQQTGLSPQEFLDRAAPEGLTDAKVREVTAWLKQEFGLGHGHAANLAQLITKGPKANAEKYNGGQPLRLVGTV